MPDRDMRLIAITPGRGIGIDKGALSVACVLAALDVGAEVLVRETAIPLDLPLDRVILHARMPGSFSVGSAIHLSAEMDIASARRRFGGGITASAHSAKEAADKRDAGADAVFLSPIFAPRHGRIGLGTSALAGFIALGGVTPANMTECRDAGAVGVAAMDAIFGGEPTPDTVRAAIQSLRAALIRPHHPRDQNSKTASS